MPFRQKVWRQIAVLDLRHLRETRNLDAPIIHFAYKHFLRTTECVIRYLDNIAARQPAQGIHQPKVFISDTFGARAMPETTTAMGRSFDEQPALRELLIAFGDSGYIALYCHEPAEDTVYVLAFGHQKEAG